MFAHILQQAIYLVFGEEGQLPQLLGRSGIEVDGVFAQASQFIPVRLIPVRFVSGPLLGCLLQPKGRDLFLGRKRKRRQQEE